MAKPMKTCSSCKGTGQIVDVNKKQHMESGNTLREPKKDMKQMPSSKPKNLPVEKGKK